MFDPRPDFGRPDAGLLAALRTEGAGSKVGKTLRRIVSLPPAEARAVLDRRLAARAVPADATFERRDGEPEYAFVIRGTVGCRLSDAKATDLISPAAIRRQQSTSEEIR